ncbi:MAG: hypothetical protein JOZ81_13020 [Chloroflexi bacterium]|nr:hypothetical protein [Chloroflexota bacterium]MBV9595216.1 hypothetical protein [Chloroflexota bacterium]
MSLLKSTRLAWSVALASLALWTFSAPISWGQAASAAGHFFDDQSTSDGDTTAYDPNAAAPCTPASPAPSVAPAGPMTFRVCGPDPQTEQAISQLIAGRGFSATLVSRADGCADLTITPSDQAAGSTGSASSNLSMSLGSGRRLSIKITSESGATHVSIGSS